MANSVDPDQMPHSAASDLGLQFAKANLTQNLGYYGILLLIYIPYLTVFRMFQQ